jgi:thiamine pyrophosphate-dependent acetolactate synthase large subunit-like protein
LNKAIYRSLNDYASKRKSRREFIRTVSALGVTPLAAESLVGYMQQNRSGVSERQLENGDAEIVEGTAGALLVAQLKAAGVKYIFHTNTSGVETIMDGVLKTAGMDVIMVTHEGQAVSAAQGYAMATGELAFFVGADDGVDNAASNLHMAFADTVPLIISFEGNPADLLAPLEPHSVWHHKCTDAETMPEMLRRGIKFAVAPPGGPVAMQFPSPLQRRQIKAPIYKMPSPVKNRAVFHAPQSEIEQVSRLLAESRNPLFIAGREVNRGGAIKTLQALAEKLSVPVCQTHRRDKLYCDFPTDHPLFLGSYLSPMRFPENCDLLVNFGGQSQRARMEGVRTVHVSSNVGELENAIGDQVPVLADVASTIQELSDALDGLLTKDRMTRIRAERLEVVSAYTQKRKETLEIALRGVFDEVPISFERLGYELEQALDQNAVIVPEIGSQDQKVYQHLTFGPDNKGRIGRTTGGQLGWGLGAAFGVQLALPDRQIVSILGDGGMLFGQTEELWSLSRYDAPMLVVVLNNHGYNETRVRNLTSGNGRRQYQTGHDMNSYLGNPDVNFAKMAEAYGISGEKVYDPNDLAPALQRAIKIMRDGRPYMLDVEVGREGLMNESTWHPEISIAGMRRG